MSVQLENGFTKIAHELLEIIPFYKFNGTQFSILIVIIRYTYGFNRKDHELSLTYLTQATGIKRSQIDRELSLLIDKKVVSVTQEATATVSRKLALNKHYDKWTIERRYPLIRGQSPNQSIPELGSEVSPNQSTGGVPYLEYQDIKRSLNIPKDITDTTKPPELVLQDEFCRIHEKGDWTLKPSEYQNMQKITAMDIPLDFIINTMTKIHEHKKSKSEKVTSFNFYLDPIVDAWKAKNGGQANGGYDNNTGTNKTKGDRIPEEWESLIVS
ncbi:MAG: hypothetical protein JWM44_2317 [Bacilli bacterium]|nr:hypothetical protein [Bacilli bacterium]